MNIKFHNCLIKKKNISKLKFNTKKNTKTRKNTKTIKNMYNVSTGGGGKMGSFITKVLRKINPMMSSFRNPHTFSEAEKNKATTARENVWRKEGILGPTESLEPANMYRRRQPGRVFHEPEFEETKDLLFHERERRRFPPLSIEEQKNKFMNINNLKKEQEAYTKRKEILAEYHNNTGFKATRAYYNSAGKNVSDEQIKNIISGKLLTKKPLNKILSIVNIVKNNINTLKGNSNA